MAQAHNVLQNALAPNEQDERNVTPDRPITVRDGPPPPPRLIRQTRQYRQNEAQNDLELGELINIIGNMTVNEINNMTDNDIDNMTDNDNDGTYIDNADPMITE
jgi:hypothetical protein